MLAGAFRRTATRRLVLGGGALLLGARRAPAGVPADADEIGQKLDTGDFLTPGFVAEFETMPAFRRGRVQSAPARPLTDPSFTWTAGYTHDVASPPRTSAGRREGPAPAFSTLPHEMEVYPNADAIAASGISPFSIAHGALVISATPLPPEMRPLVADALPKDYLSGAICSYPFGQTYGYFELRGRIPAGRGLWPTFWLLPTDMSWPPEFDVMEVLGHEPGKLHTTTHSKRLAQGSSIGHATMTGDLSMTDHAFGVDWGPAQVRYYFDRRLVFAHPTPDDCHQPFYLLANLAVGGPGSWPGPPDATTAFPARFSIESIRAWQRAAYV